MKFSIWQNPKRFNLKRIFKRFVNNKTAALDRAGKLFYDFEMSKPANRLEVPSPIVKTTEGKTNPNAEAPKSELPAFKKSIYREYFESFVVTLIMAFFGMTFIVQAVTVPTGSMQNTINIGDHFLVNKFIFAPGPPLPFLPMREIRRGDIVVFKYPGNKIDPAEDREQKVTPYQTNYIKRVIGLPGDTVEFREDHVYINGEMLPEYRLSSRNPRVTSAIDSKEFEAKPSGANYTVYYSEDSLEDSNLGLLNEQNFNFGVAGKPSKVPDNQYFMMGDNRDNSGDSRVWGFVPRELIVGRAMFVYWSCDQSTGTGFLDCLTHPRFERIGKLIK